MYFKNSIRIGSPTLGKRKQVCCVPEHFFQRDFAAHRRAGGRIFHSLNDATASVEITDDITHVILRRYRLDLHDRLEKNRCSFRGTLFESHRAGDLERNLTRVDIMMRTVVQRHLYIDHRVPGNYAIRHLLLDAFIHGIDVLARHHSANDGVVELVASSRLSWLDTQPNVAILPTPAGLADKFAFLFDCLLNGFREMLPAVCRRSPQP